MLALEHVRLATHRDQQPRDHRGPASISDEGRQWFEDNVGEPEPGGIYTCEPRMAQDILQAAARDLLSMQ